MKGRDANVTGQDNGGGFELNTKRGEKGEARRREETLTLCPETEIC